MVEVYILPKLTQTLCGYIDCLATSHQYYQLSPPVAIMALWDSFEIQYRGIFNVFVVSGLETKQYIGTMRCSSHAAVLVHSAHVLGTVAADLADYVMLTS